MNALEALARTILLARKDLLPGVTDDEVLGALTSVRVLLVADELNLGCPEGQHALISAATLAARSGAECYIDAPNVPLLGVHPLLRERHIVDALLEIGADLVPGQTMRAGRAGRNVDLLVAIGDTESSAQARQRVAVSATAWEGRLGGRGERFVPTESPFGAMAAATLAGTEAYKHAMRRLRWHAAHGVFDDFFRETVDARIAFAPRDTPPPTPVLGAFDTVSGGAIVQGALYALSKIPGVSADARVIEPDVHALTNVNRYPLLRCADLKTAKASAIARLNLGGIQITPVPDRYDERLRRTLGPLAADVLVGVDNVESRWVVQDECPEWLGIGATEGYLAFRTVHEPGVPCARCVHPEGSLPAGEIPTAAFVSFWGGLSLAAAFALRRTGVRPAGQVLQLSCLQMGSSSGVLEGPGTPEASCGCRTRADAAA